MRHSGTGTPSFGGHHGVVSRSDGPSTEPRAARDVGNARESLDVGNAHYDHFGAPGGRGPGR